MASVSTSLLYDMPSNRSSDGRKRRPRGPMSRERHGPSFKESLHELQKFQTRAPTNTNPHHTLSLSTLDRSSTYNQRRIRAWLATMPGDEPSPVPARDQSRSASPSRSRPVSHRSRSRSKTPQRSPSPRPQSRSRSPSRARSYSRSRSRSPTRSPTSHRNGRRSYTPDSRSRSRSPRGRSYTRSPSRRSSPQAPRSAKVITRQAVRASSAWYKAVTNCPQIVIEHLTKNVNKDHIREIFGSYGPIKDIVLPLNLVCKCNLCFHRIRGNPC